MPLPKPLKREKETSFIGRCVPLVLEQEGLDKDDEKQRKIAVAICYGLWRKAKGGKAMEIEDLAGLSFDVDGEEVIFEDLIEAYKAREDVKDDGEREKAKKAQKARSKKHGIAVLDHGNITKPGEWDALSDAQFGDPVNYRYPIHDKAHARNARARFAQEDFTYKGRGKVGDRIEKAAKKFKIGEFAPKSLDDQDGDEKSLSFGVRISVVRRAFEQMSRPPKMPVPEAASDYWYINSDDIFDDYVVAKLGEKDAYKVPYTMDKDGNVEFAPQDEWEKVEREWVPSKAVDYCIKRLGETDTGWYIGGYGMIWGSGKQRDLSPWPNADGSKGEFFTLQTQGLDDLPVKVITFEHDKEKGPDGEPFRHVLGTTVLERDDVIGRWIEALIEKRRKYANYVVDLIDQQALNFSSETASHWREVAEDGEIKMWRTAGYTTTTHPMEPRLTDVNRLKAYYKSLDLDLAEPDMGGAPEDGGLEMEKAKAQARILLSRIRKGEVKEL